MYMYDVRNMNVQQFDSARLAQQAADDMNKYITRNGCPVIPGGTFRVANRPAMLEIVAKYVRSGRTPVCGNAKRLGLMPPRR